MRNEWEDIVDLVIGVFGSTYGEATAWVGWPIGQYGVGRANVLDSVQSSAEQKAHMQYLGNGTNGGFNRWRQRPVRRPRGLRADVSVDATEAVIAWDTAFELELSPLSRRSELAPRHAR